MDAERPSETFISTYQDTRRHDPQDSLFIHTPVCYSLGCLHGPQRWGTARPLPKFLCCSMYCLCVNVYCTVLYCTVLYCTVLYCCHRVAMQLQLTNISYHVSYLSHRIVSRRVVSYIISYHNISHHIYHIYNITSYNILYHVSHHIIYITSHHIS